MPKGGSLEIWPLYASHQFAIAPVGVGYDTFRVWEYLFFGTVPIVLSSPLDAMYIDAHVPIIIVKDWKEVCEWTEDDMENLFERFHKWVANSHMWLRPSLWVPRDQDQMEMLCDASPGCRSDGQFYNAKKLDDNKSVIVRNAGHDESKVEDAGRALRYLLDSVMAAVQEPKSSFPVPSDAQFVPSSTAFPNISIFPIRQFYQTHGLATPKFGNVNFEGISAHWDPIQVTLWDEQRRRPTGKGPAYAKPEDGGKAVLGTWPTKLNRLTMLHLLKCGGSTMMDTVGDLRQRLQATGDVWTWGQRSRTDDPSMKTWDDAIMAGTNDRRHAIVATVRDPVARFVSAVKEVAREEKGLIDQCFKGDSNNTVVLNCAANSLSALSGQKKFLQNKHWATQAHTIFANVLRRPDSKEVIPLVLLPFELMKQLIHELGGDPLFNYRNGTDRSYFDWSINSKVLSTQTKHQLTTLKVNDLDTESIKLICNLYNVDVQLLKWAGVDVPLCQPS